MLPWLRLFIYTPLAKSLRQFSKLIQLHGKLLLRLIVVDLKTHRAYLLEQLLLLREELVVLMARTYFNFTSLGLPNVLSPTCCHAIQICGHLYRFCSSLVNVYCPICVSRHIGSDLLYRWAFTHRPDFWGREVASPMRLESAFLFQRSLHCFCQKFFLKLFNNYY